MVSMFEKLGQKWKVGGWRLFLILVTFATGGSLTGWIGRRIMNATGIDTGVLYFVLYILLITFIWPFAVLLVSLPLGQFRFFKTYIGRIFQRFNKKKDNDGKS